MSVSPQSLARNRDKRSLKIPARFEDFDDIPPEVTRNPPTMSKNQNLKSSIEKDSSSLSAKKTPAVSKPLADPTPTANKKKDDLVNLAVKPIDDVVLPLKPITPTQTTTTTAPSATSATSTIITTTVPTSPPSNPIPSLPRSPLPMSAPDCQNTKATTGSSKRKSKGHSLIANGPANKPFQCNTNIKCVNPPLQPNHSQTRYITTNNFNSSALSRLIPNGAVLLPYSVPNIGPITMTPQQLLNQSRRPPFISKRAEAFLTYQNERKLSYLASPTKALIRIMSYLEVKDLLNLRLVDKTFKSIVDSDAVWKRVLVESSNIIDWEKFTKKILAKYETTDLVLLRYMPPAPNSDLVAFALESASLRTLTITSVNPQQNKFALELLCHLASRSSLPDGARMIWKVKVVVDACGIAQVVVQCRDHDSLQSPRVTSRNLYCYKAIQRLLGDEDETVQVEISDLESLFNRNEKDEYANHPTKLNVEIRAI